MKPNKYSQAVKELQAMGIKDIPNELKEIKEREATHWVVAGIISRDNADKTQKIHTIEKTFANEKAWIRMQLQIKQNLFKQPFAGKYNKVIILHDPTYTPPKPKTKKVETAEVKPEA